MAQSLLLKNTGGLSLKETFGCGQTFRWRQEGNAFVGVVNGQTVRARQSGDGIRLEGDRLADADFWCRYFALDMDYAAIHQKLNKSVRLGRCIAFAPGIRVLRQPFFETLLTFIISQNNNIPRITGIVSQLSEQFGTDGAFPTAEQIAALNEADLACLRAGWRAGYILDAARKAASGEIREETLSGLSTDEARQTLMRIRGVGPKVADCVLLFSLGRWDSFPQDVWIRRAMAQWFPKGLPKCARGFEGIAQQYLFHYIRSHAGDLSRAVGK